MSAQLQLEAAEMTQAWRDGFKAGRADRRLGTRLTYSWYVEATTNYSQQYALGYRVGFTEQGTLDNLLNILLISIERMSEEEKADIRQAIREKR